MRLAHFQFNPETDRLGEGPLSEVYKARDTELGRTVALKILRAHAEIDPAADQRFAREARHTSSLEHPNIATIYEYGQDKGTSFIAMEYLEGRTLDKVIKERALGYEECMRIALQLTEALSIVHERHMIHRDLKPANILLQDDGTLKLLDFGIARARDEASITQHGMLVGTVLYMSPEQVRGDKLDSRSDVFSLGAVLYHVITGSLPFPGESFPEVCMAILDGRPRRKPSEVRPGLPKPIEDFILSCLQGDPDERFSDARVADGELRLVQEQVSSTPAQSPLKGTLILPELSCGGPFPESCHVMAGALRKDLAAELARNKGLAVVLQDVTDLEPGARCDYVLYARLDIVGNKGSLTLNLEFHEGTYTTGTLRMTTDVVTAEDADDWTVQADLVRQAMRVLRRRLTEIQVEATGKRMVEEALAMCAQARDIMRRGRTKHLLAATTILRRALEHDRYCAEAEAGLAEAMVRKFLHWDGDQSFLAEAREHAGRALEIDPKCAHAHTALGFAFHLSGQLEDAQREYRLATQLDKQEWFAYRLLGAALARAGNYKNAAPVLARAIGLEPRHIASYDHQFNVLSRLDRFDEALETADDGVAAAQRRLDEVPDDMDALVHLAMLYVRIGNHARALATAESALARAPKDGYTAFHVAAVYAGLGDIPEAITLLKAAADRGYYVKSELNRNSDFDVLGDQPEYRELTA